MHKHEIAIIGGCTWSWSGPSRRLGCAVVGTIGYRFAAGGQYSCSTASIWRSSPWPPSAMAKSSIYPRTRGRVFTSSSHRRMVRCGSCLNPHGTDIGRRHSTWRCGEGVWRSHQKTERSLHRLRLRACGPHVAAELEPPTAALWPLTRIIRCWKSSREKSDAALSCRGKILSNKNEHNLFHSNLF